MSTKENKAVKIYNVPKELGDDLIKMLWELTKRGVIPSYYVEMKVEHGPPKARKPNAL